MKAAGHIAAAIEVLSVIEKQHVPAKTALADWGRSHRFAGSSDRAAIGNLVFDALRMRASIAWRMEDESARALAIGAFIWRWGEDVERLQILFAGDRFAPRALTDQELNHLRRASLDEAPLWVKANLPEWIAEKLEPVFRSRLLLEGQAMAQRAPIDIRVNGLKANLDKVQNVLSQYHPVPLPYSQLGLRFAPPRAAEKSPALEAELAHGKGWFEIQDEGAQIASLLTGARAGDQVLDYCAGAGGKTLALASMMNNKGQIHAYDADKHRLRPIIERLKRAGARNVQTHRAGDREALSQLEGTMDIVLVDSPCSGSGTWRRHPDAKWRLSENHLHQRCQQQTEVLDQVASYVKPGGKLVYVTCSLFDEENQQQLDAFVERHKMFSIIPVADQWSSSLPGKMPPSADGSDKHLLLSPAYHSTDGFFIAIMERGA